MCGISGISGITSSVDTWSLIRACRALGVKLSVTRDDVLICEPDSSLTDDLREAIRANHEELIYDVLLAEAHRYVLVERYVEGADVGSVLASHEEEINAAYLAREWPAFRAAIRAFVRAGLREIEQARALDLFPASLDSPRTMTKGARV